MEDYKKNLPLPLSLSEGEEKPVEVFLPHQAQPSVPTRKELLLETLKRLQSLPISPPTEEIGKLEALLSGIQTGLASSITTLGKYIGKGAEIFSPAAVGEVSSSLTLASSLTKDEKLRERLQKEAEELTKLVTTPEGRQEIKKAASLLEEKVSTIAKKISPPPEKLEKIAESKFLTKVAFNVGELVGQYGLLSLGSTFVGLPVSIATRAALIRGLGSTALESSLARWALKMVPEVAGDTAFFFAIEGANPQRLLQNLTSGGIFGALRTLAPKRLTPLGVSLAAFIDAKVQGLPLDEAIASATALGFASAIHALPHMAIHPDLNKILKEGGMTKDEIQKLETYTELKRNNIKLNPEQEKEALQLIDKAYLIFDKKVREEIKSRPELWKKMSDAYKFFLSGKAEILPEALKEIGKYVDDLSDLLEKKGASKEEIEKFRERIFKLTQKEGQVSLSPEELKEVNRIFRWTAITDPAEGAFLTLVDVATPLKPRGEPKTFLEATSHILNDVIFRINSTLESLKRRVAEKTEKEATPEKIPRTEVETKILEKAGNAIGSKVVETIDIIVDTAKAYATVYDTAISGRLERKIREVEPSRWSTYAETLKDLTDLLLSDRQLMSRVAELEPSLREISSSLRNISENLRKTTAPENLEHTAKWIKELRSVEEQFNDALKRVFSAFYDPSTFTFDDVLTHNLATVITIGKLSGLAKTLEFDFSRLPIEQEQFRKLASFDIIKRQTEKRVSLSGLLENLIVQPTSNLIETLKVKDNIIDSLKEIRNRFPNEVRKQITSLVEKLSQAEKIEDLKSTITNIVEFLENQAQKDPKRREFLSPVIDRIKTSGLETSITELLSIQKTSSPLLRNFLSFLFTPDPDKKISTASLLLRELREAEEHAKDSNVPPFLLQIDILNKYAQRFLENLLQKENAKVGVVTITTSDPVSIINKLGIILNEEATKKGYKNILPLPLVRDKGDGTFDVFLIKEVRGMPEERIEKSLLNFSSLLKEKLLREPDTGILIRDVSYTLLRHGDKPAKIFTIVSQKQKKLPPFFLFEGTYRNILKEFFAKQGKKVEIQEEQEQIRIIDETGIEAKVPIQEVKTALSINTPKDPKNTQVFDEFSPPSSSDLSSSLKFLKEAKEGFEPIIDENPIISEKNILKESSDPFSQLGGFLGRKSPFFRPFLEIYHKIADSLAEAKKTIKQIYTEHLVNAAYQMGYIHQAIIDHWRMTGELSKRTLAEVTASLFKHLSEEEAQLFITLYTNRGLVEKLSEWKRKLDDPSSDLPKELRTEEFISFVNNSLELWNRNGKLVEILERLNDIVYNLEVQFGLIPTNDTIGKWPEVVIVDIQKRINKLNEEINITSQVEKKNKLIAKKAFYENLLQEISKYHYFPRAYTAKSDLQSFMSTNLMLNKITNEALINTISRLIKEEISSLPKEERTNERISQIRQKYMRILKEFSETATAEGLKKLLSNISPTLEVGTADRTLLAELLSFAHSFSPFINIDPTLEHFGLKKEKRPTPLWIKMFGRGYTAEASSSERQILRKEAIPTFERKFISEKEAIQWALENNLHYLLDPVYVLGNYLSYIDAKLQTRVMFKSIRDASVEALKENLQLVREHNLPPNSVITHDVLVVPLEEKRLLKSMGVDIEELGFRKLPPSFRIPELENSYVHPLLLRFLEDESFAPSWVKNVSFSEKGPLAKVINNAIRIWDQFSRTTKMLTFYIPMIMVNNNISQMWFLAGPKAFITAPLDLPKILKEGVSLLTKKEPKVIGRKYHSILGYLWRAAYEVANDTEIVKEATRAGLFMDPLSLREDVGRLAKEIHRTALNDPLYRKIWTYIENGYRRASGVYGIPVAGKIIESLYKDVLAKVTWTADKIQRTALLLWYLDHRYTKNANGDVVIREPLAFKAACDTVRKVMANYRGIPNRTRRYLNLVFLTPTYRIEMLKLHGRIAAAFAEDPKKNFEPLLNYMTAKALAFSTRWWLTASFWKILAGLAGAGMATLIGNEEMLEEELDKIQKAKERLIESPGWTLRNFYRLCKKIPGTDMEQILVLPGPLFEIDKYLGRDPLFSAYIYSNKPSYVIISLLRNRDWRGREIVPPGSGPIETSMRIFSFVLRSSLLPPLESILNARTDDWTAREYLLNSLGIAFYKAKNPAARLVGLVKYEERKLREEVFRRYQQKGFLDEKDREWYEERVKRIYRLYRQIDELSQRQYSPKLIDNLLNAYASLWGVSFEKMRSMVEQEIFFLSRPEEIAESILGADLSEE